MKYIPVKYEGFIKADNPRKIAKSGDKILMFDKMYDLKKAMPDASYDKIYVMEDGEVVDIRY